MFSEGLHNEDDFAYKTLANQAFLDSEGKPACEHELAENRALIVHLEAIFNLPGEPNFALRFLARSGRRERTVVYLFT